MRRTRLLSIAIISWTSLGGMAQAAMISLVPQSQTVAAGAPVVFALNVSGLNASTALGAFDVSVNFDSAALSFQSATFGDPTLGDQLDLNHFGLNGPTATPSVGTVDLIETDLFDSPSALLASQAKSFTLATLVLTGLAPGATPLTLTLNSLADQNSNSFTATPQGTVVEVTPVPLPGANTLFSSALVALALVAAVRQRRLKPVGVLPTP